MPPKSAAAETQVVHERYGEIASGKWRVYDIAGITADMAEPSGANVGVFSTVGAEIAWLVLFPAGVASCKLSTYRRAGIVANDTEVVPPEWVRDDSETLTESGIVFQYNLGDRTAPRIHDIVGAPGSSFRILYKRCSRRA